MGIDQFVVIPRETAEWLYDQMRLHGAPDLSDEIGQFGAIAFHLKFRATGVHHFQQIGDALGKPREPMLGPSGPVKEGS